MLRAPWRKIVCTPVDTSIKTHLAPAMVKQIDASGTAVGHYVSPFAQFAPGADIRWNETRRGRMDRPEHHHETRNALHERESRPRAELRRYAHLVRKRQAGNPVHPVEIQADLDKEKFYRMFVNLMSAPTPATH